ncbi:MAG: hypothetical protein CSA26_06275 [Desulfobacterales bacterium]|nr:MAG: hypothetical protein CSA26_06275 [Desulfobacterales bacterium]
MALIGTFLERLSYFIDRFSRGFILIIMVVMVSVISLQIFCRYVLNSALIWPEELTIFLMAWMTFVGSAIALRDWEHIGIDFFVGKLSTKHRNITNIAVKLLVMFFVVFLLFTGIFLVGSSSHMISEALRISLVWPRLSVPVGASFMLVHIIHLTYQDICKLRHNKENA